VQCLVRNEQSQAAPNRNLLRALVPDAPLAAQKDLAEGMGLDYRRMADRLKAGLGEAFVR
jgi:hypothetical protein